MVDDSHIKPGSSEVQYKRCADCRANLPTSEFGRAKISKGGYAGQCNPCRSQFQRLYRQLRFSSISKVDDSLIRCVKNHNLSILRMALSLPDFKCIGFIPHTGKVVRVHFGRSRYDMESMAVFGEDGTWYFEVAYSGLNPENSMDQLMTNLKKYEIRLELNDACMIASKNVVYGLWIK
jgi:hypothetical protein